MTHLDVSLTQDNVDTWHMYVVPVVFWGDPPVKYTIEMFNMEHYFKQASRWLSFNPKDRR